MALSFTEKVNMESFCRHNADMQEMSFTGIFVANDDKEFKSTLIKL